jgi:YrbI family 3-deoxy-D-manno-octulosonate 8-phosphate phosphatase
MHYWSNKDIRKTILALKLAFFDFDGVFTNNQVIVSQDGTESIICNRADGLGLRRLESVNITPIIISTEVNPVVSIRAKKLCIKCIQGCENKLTVLKDQLNKRNASLKNVAYIGNDINDESCLKVVGLPVVVADAFEEIKPLARLVLSKKGGKGAVREFCDHVFFIKSEIKDG